MILRIFIFALILLQSTLGFTQTKEISTEFSSLTLQYNSNEHQLSEESIKKLKDFIGKSVQAKDHKIQIESHTDQVGSSTANQMLAQKRTQAVKNVLTNFGVDSTQISGTAYGESRPLKSGKDEQSNSENRRSVIRIMKPMTHYLLKGSVRPDTVTKNFSAKVLISGGTYRDSAIVGKDREFSMYVPMGQKLNLSASAKNFFSQSLVINVPKSQEIPPVNIILKSIKIDKVFDINDIKFVGDQAGVLPESEPALNNLLKTMQINEKVCFEIGGHTNFPGAPLSSGKFFDLAIDRANSIYNYLNKNGIDPKRMNAVGYSNTKMKFPNPRTEAEHQENRRVEIIIRKCDQISKTKK